jgi:hypothetical protein
MDCQHISLLHMKLLEECDCVQRSPMTTTGSCVPHALILQGMDL